MPDYNIDGNSLHVAIQELLATGATISEEAESTITRCLLKLSHIRPEDIAVFWDEDVYEYDIQWREDDTMCFICVSADGRVKNVDKVVGNKIVPLTLDLGSDKCQITI